MKEIKSVQEFDSYLNNDNQHNKRYVFIDFYATWCGPCKRIGPTLIEFSTRYNNKIVYIKVNIEEEELEEIQDRYEVRKLPTFIIIDTTISEPIIRIEGANKEKLENKLKMLEGGITRSTDF
jgi:thioredoxin 1